MHKTLLACVDSQIEGLVGNSDDDAIFDAYAQGEIDGDKFRGRVLAAARRIRGDRRIYHYQTRRRPCWAKYSSLSAADWRAAGLPQRDGKE
jgi:hypothetical protein